MSSGLHSGGGLGRQQRNGRHQWASQSLSPPALSVRPGKMVGLVRRAESQSVRFPLLGVMEGCEQGSENTTLAAAHGEWRVGRKILKSARMKGNIPEIMQDDVVKARPRVLAARMGQASPLPLWRQELEKHQTCG